MINLRTDKSLSEALIFASTNPQYDDRLFIQLQVQYMKIPSSNLRRTYCVQKLLLTFRTISVHNIFSPCSAKIRPPDKNLPVTTSHFRGKGETSYFLLNSVVNCEKNDNKHSLIRSVKNEFLDKFQAKRLLMQSRR